MNNFSITTRTRPKPRQRSGVTATATYRVRLTEDNISDPKGRVSYRSQNNEISVNHILVNKAQRSNDFKAWTDRSMRNWDQITLRIVRFIEGRAKVTIAKFAAEFSIDSVNVPILADVQYY